MWAVAADVPLERYGAAAVEAGLRDLEWVTDVAVRHEAVVGHMAGRGATVVPMKLFTMFTSDDRAVADLRRRRRDISTVLDRIRRCEEWGVRVTRRAPPVGRTRSLPRATTGTAFLAAKKRVRDRAREDAQRVLDAAEASFGTLSSLARSVARRDPPPGVSIPPLVDAAFLVPSASRARFHVAAKRSAAACRRAGAVLTLTGPWPPYNFVAAPAAGSRGREAR